jgi:hypothetical protein
MENKDNRRESQNASGSDKRHASPRSDDQGENTGDWDDLRDDTRTDDNQRTDYKNDNTGGAGSTGSAVNNSQ